MSDESVGLEGQGPVPPEKIDCSPAPSGERRGEAEQIATVAISSSSDIIAARQQGRDLARTIGFAEAEAVLIATAISELARNIVVYANTGEIRLEGRARSGRRGLQIVARDDGSGIRNLDRVLAGGYSTSGGLGLGIAGVRQIMDEFSIDTGIGRGTEVIATKWSS